MQNSRFFKNFHDVPLDKIVLFCNKAILKVKFCKGTEIIKKKKVVHHVLIAEIKQKVLPVYCKSWLAGTKKGETFFYISYEIDHHVEGNNIHSM